MTKYLAAAASLAAALATGVPINPAANLSLGKTVRAGSVSKQNHDLLGGVIIAVVAAAAAAVPSAS